jgi:hypothetical protein
MISQATFQDKSHTLEYDGIATTVFPSAEAANAYTHDPEYMIIAKQYSKLITHDGSFLSAGGEEVVMINQNTSK